MNLRNDTLTQSLARYTTSRCSNPDLPNLDKVSKGWARKRTHRAILVINFASPQANKQTTHQPASPDLSVQTKSLSDGLREHAHRAILVIALAGS